MAIVRKQGQRIVRCGIRKDGWTVRRRADFLDMLAVTCNVKHSARSVGMSQESARLLRLRDGEFAQLWDAALEQGQRRLEEELLACALGQVPSGDNPTGERKEPEQLPPFDPHLAIKILGMRAGTGRIGQRRRAGVPPSQGEIDAALLSRLQDMETRLAKHERAQ